MIWIILGVYFILFGILGIFPNAIPHWPMLAAAIAVGLACLWVGFGKAKPPST